MMNTTGSSRMEVLTRSGAEGEGLTLNGAVHPRSSGSLSHSGTSNNCSISCNRCRKSLSTTVFVCSCDCAFCEECTYAHFNSSSRCPSCGKSLSANDFIELVVADPSSATEEALKNTFQAIFTKFSPNSNALSHQEMCSRLLKSFDNGRRVVRFLLKQIVVDGNTRGRRYSKMVYDLENVNKEYTALKQASSSQRIQLEQTIGDLQHRVQALNGTVQELQLKLDEKEMQISQFRQLYAVEGMARLPNASAVHGSGGRKPRSSGSGGRSVNEGSGPIAYNQSRHHGRPVVSSSSAAKTPPPLQGFVLQKQAREQAGAQALADMTRARVIPISGPCIASRSINNPNMMANQIHPGLRHSRSGDTIPSNNVGQLYRQQQRDEIDSVITPIQIPGQVANHPSEMSHLNAWNGSSVDARGQIPGTPRIRDLSANSGYVFTSRSSNGIRQSSTNTNNSYENQQNKRGRISVSPSGQMHHHFGFSRKW